MNRLKQLRTEKNITQDVLAKLLCMEVAGYSKLETERVPLKDEYILKLADFFDVSTDYLLGKSDIRNNNENIENNAFFRVMQNAEKKGYTPEDMQMALDFLDRARKRDTKNEN